MFCLRSWIPILFFLTNASPIYLLLFVSATYFLNRPCVYCSLLLGILLVSLFDFQAGWFEPRYSSSASLPSIYSAPASRNQTSGSSTRTSRNVTDLHTIPSPVEELILPTAEALAAAMNSSAGMLIEGMKDSIKSRLGTESAGAGTGAASGVKEWIGGLLAGKREFKIHCMDVLVRL